jgi:hypothetical protein
MTEEHATAVAEQPPSFEPQAPDGSGPPSGEQAGQQQGQVPASKPRPPLDARALQAGLTRATQSNAAIKKALGLSARATDQEVAAKIEALTSPQSYDGGDDYDPVVAEREKELIEREWKTAERVAGPEKVALARSIQELAFTNSPLDFVDAVVEMIEQFAPQAQQQPPASNGAAQPQQGRVDDIAPEGDSPVGWQVRPEQDEVGSGDVEGAARRLFARLGGGAR